MFTVQQLSNGDTKILANGDSKTAGSVTVEWLPGVDIEIGRGTADPDRTFVAVRNSSGVKYYIYVDTTTIVASTTHP